MDTKPPETPKTLQEAIRYFSDPDTCLALMVAIRCPDGNVRCPLCGSEGARFLANQRRWECREKHPRRQFSVKVGTIFEDSPLSLETWLPAVWLITNAKNGISSYEIHRALDVTQKTAWFMLHRIRLATRTGAFNKMIGDVEADETFIGGKARFMHAGKRAAKITGTGGKDKSAVMGLLERHGPGRKTSRVRVKVVQTRKSTSYRPRFGRTSSLDRTSIPTRWPRMMGSPRTTPTKSSTTRKPTCAGRSTPTALKTSGRC